MNEQKYCETCKFLNDEVVPAECKKEHGKVAYRHKACEDYKEDKKKHDV